MCLFCKIINGEIPSYKVYEDEDTLAFLDISQVSKGHTLVIPKTHCENIFDLDEKSCQKLLNTVKYVSILLKEKLNVQNINIINNNGSVAGQVINHFHIHILPRHENDNIKIHTPGNDFNADTLKSTLNELTK